MGNGQSSALPMEILQDLFPDQDALLLQTIAEEIARDEAAALNPDTHTHFKEFKTEAWQRRRLNWTEHVHESRHCNTFRRKYRMSYDAFSLLVKILEPSIRVDYSRHRHGDPIPPEITVAIGIRFMTGVPVLGMIDIYKMSIAQVYRCRDSFIKAVLTSHALQINLPQTAEEWESVRMGFERKSRDGLFHGTCGAIDGFFQATTRPKKSDVRGNVLAYFSGHYKQFGLNCQAACDSDLRFLYFGVVGPGKTNDNVAYEFAKELKEAVGNLPLGLYMVGDAAYTLQEHLLIPFTGSQKDDPNSDAFNFYLSQLRIRIEMAFGRLTNKWRILRGRLQGSLETCSKIVFVCAILHNFCIDQDGPTSAGDEEDSDDSQSQHQRDDFVVRQAPNGMQYLPTIPDGEEDPVRVNNFSHARQSIIDRISSEVIRRPQHNIQRNNPPAAVVTADESNIPSIGIEFYTSA